MDVAVVVNSWQTRQGLEVLPRHGVQRGGLAANCGDDMPARACMDGCDTGGGLQVPVAAENIAHPQT